MIELVSRIGDEAGFRPWYYQLASGRGQRYGAIKVEDADWPAALDRALTRCLR